LTTINAAIICINETWLKTNTLTFEVFDDNNYVVFRKDRTCGRGGGVILAIKPHLSPKRLPELENGSELIWAEIVCGGSRILLGSAYRSPSNNDNENRELLASLQQASAVSNKYSACVLCGDFNLAIDWGSDTPKPLNPLANNFLTLFYDFVPYQLINSPTREINNTSSILDLILCDSLDVIEKATVIPGVSDHHALHADFNLTDKPVNPAKNLFIIIAVLIGLDYVTCSLITCLLFMIILISMMHGNCGVHVFGNA
jgi:hypothetical protein